MASEEPLFDSSLKKRKKKQVAFSEDPLGAEDDPTTPAPETIDSHTLNGDAVDLGPKTAHEQLKQAAGGDEEGGDKKDEDFKAMFGDMKKKKKKKEIPMDFGDDSAKASAPAASEDLDFSDMKKKKKEIPLYADDEGAPPAPSEDLDFSDLKKKKKKAEIPLYAGEENSGTSTPAGAAEDLDFSDIKKKKKSSKKKATFDLEAFEKELQDSKAKDGDEDDEVVPDGEHLADLDEAELGDDPFAHGAEAPAGIDSGSEPWLQSDRDYTYPELLHRFYASLHASNPSLLTSSGKRYTIAPPQLFREGNKKSIFANVTEICKRMHRQPEHVIQFLFAEMGTTGSVDGAGRLVIKGRFQQKQVENVLRRYIVEYVTCKTCKSPDTLLTKEKRIFFMSCESCGSQRSVNAIKSGFQAQVGKRSKNKTG